VELLAGRHEVELFHAQDAVEVARLPAGATVHRVSALLARHHERPFDLAVYQMGNGPAHDFVYDLLSRLPGLLVLHDLVLHHSRAARFLDSEAVRAWRHDPSSASARAAARPSLDAVAGRARVLVPRPRDEALRGPPRNRRDLLPYAYPLFRIPVEASRAVAVHNAFTAAAVRAEVLRPRWRSSRCRRRPSPSRRRRWRRCGRGSASREAT